MSYEEYRLATMAQADTEYATNVGSQNREKPWILSDLDVWHQNPFYKGPPVPHPESESVEDEGFCPLSFKEASEVARKLAANTGRRVHVVRADTGNGWLAMQL